jgi:hypothetical protein
VFFFFFVLAGLKPGRYISSKSSLSSRPASLL